MKRLVILVILAGFTWAPLHAQGLDQYGGSLDLQCPNGAKGYFYAQEIGNRWWLCDALGNAFWSTSLFNVWEDPSVAVKKYGSVANWSAVTTERLKSWGFNTVDGDGSESVYPQATNPAWPGDHTIPYKMELLFYNDMTSYPTRGPFTYCSGSNLDQTKPFGELEDNSYWNYSTGSVSLDDPFDPCFSIYGYQSFADPARTANTSTGASLVASPWTIGVEAGEGDYMRGFGAGPESQDGPTGGLNTSTGFSTAGALEANNVNLGLAVVAASPWGTYNGQWNRLALRTREVYVKTEMANWLQGNGQVNFSYAQSASSSSGAVSLAFSNNLPLAYAVGDKINVQACSNASFNGQGMTVLTASGNSITYSPGSAGTASGVNYCVVSMTGAQITGATLSSGVETVMMTVNPFKTGDIVTITGVTPSTFDTTGGTGCGVTAYTATTFTCTNGSGSAAYSSGGMASSGPGYTLAELNSAWGSNYTTFGTTGTNEVVNITSDCNTTTWLCSGTLPEAPDMFSIWIKDNGTVIGGGGDTWGGATSLYGPSGISFSPPCTPTGNVVVDSSGNVTVTCTQNPEPFVVGDVVFTYFNANKTYNTPPGVGAPVTAVSGATFTYVSSKIAATFPEESNDAVSLLGNVSLSTGAFTFSFPSYPMTSASASGGVVSQGYGGGTPPLSIGMTVRVSGCMDSSFDTAAGANVSLIWVGSVIQYDQTGTGASTTGCVLSPFPFTTSDTITMDYYSGGYAKGTGLLDEAGQHSWVPIADEINMSGSGTTDAFRSDMNNFIYHFAAMWFGIARDSVKASFPNTMFMGANEAGGSWCTPARVPVLRAVGQYVDFAPLGGVVCGISDDQARLDYAEKYMSNIPIMVWTGITANPDSSVSWFAPGDADLSPAQTAMTQAQRGVLYTNQIEEYLNLQVSAGNGPASGVYPFVGIHIWDGGMDDSTQANWGLTTYPQDNAYDGYCARAAMGTGPFGYPCGGEADNYGNFLGPATRANHLWLNLIPRQLVKTSGTP